MLHNISTMFTIKPFLRGPVLRVGSDIMRQFGIMGHCL